MKFTSTAITAAVLGLASSVAAESVKLYAKSSSSAVDGKGLYGLHEGAAIDYVFFGSDSEDFNYSNSSIYATYSVAESYYYFFSVGEVVTYGLIDEPSKFTIEDGLLSYDGSTSGFAACLGVNDPYSYGATNYILSYYGSKTLSSSCVAIEIVVDGASSSSSSSSVAPVTSSSAPAVTSSSAAGYNATVTTFLTAETTTYCPPTNTSSIAISTFTGAAVANKASAGGLLALGAMAMGLFL
ncbi:uncharacterized protein V1516DRAFT_680249 [Lipomyces oligophaga]|uniref:uncharacterized protein n=1 Tax=Lipomyces oligophaga TaxID=45792 RepID=UPI0034CED25B